MNIKEYEKSLYDKAMFYMNEAFCNCPPEILFLNEKNVRIHIPKYFFDFIDCGNYFQYRGYTIDIGYENAIVIFDKENGFANNRIFKYKL